MQKKFKLSLFIFRRDLRLYDNTAYLAAVEASEKVIPCFIFDERQVKNNAFFGENAFLFLLQCLADLQNQMRSQGGKLFFFQGVAENCVENILTTLPVEAVFFNRDYTPFSQRRDGAIKALCQKMGRSFFCLSDALLHEPEEIKKKDGLPYTIFTPFYNQSMSISVGKPKSIKKHLWYDQPLPGEYKNIFDHLFSKYEKHCTFNGGRKEGLLCLENVKKIKNYEKIRDFPYIDGTSHLSAHHKFGSISIRESYHGVENETFKKELYWRDFFTHIAFHFPRIFSGAFHQKYNAIPWKNNEKHFRAWCEGKTGFPIIDAGMRELNETGYMHNRVRMIVASFLVKDLHIDWHWGEKYFANLLQDYDPAVNNGNWQWAASTGCDAQPYFRIFNPSRQQERFDPDFQYIKRWVPEYGQKTYPAPIVDHAEAAKITKTMFDVTK